MNRRPRMLQLCAVDFTVANLLLPLIQECSKSYEVEVACAPGPDGTRLEKEGIRFQYISFVRGINPLAHIRSFFQLLRLFSRERYDIVHTHTPIAGVLARIAARIKGVPLIVNTVHGFYFHEYMHPVPRLLAQAVERWVGRITDFSFFQSHEDYCDALKLGICGHERALWIGNGVDQRRFDPHRYDLHTLAIEFRRTLGASTSDILVGIVARVVREKGIGELLRSFTLLQGRFPHLRLVVVGDTLASDRDGIRHELQKACTHPEYGHRIHWLGYRRDVETVLKALDAFVLPSYREGMPRSVIEAMSMGLPVVATDIRGCREEVVPGVTGLLVPPRSVEPLADAIGRLAAEPDLRRAMGRAGFQRATELYNERLVLSRQINAFALLVGREVP